jgi:IclR family KDG regulon transcriptional repressor
MVKREKANYMIQSVSHAIDVLEELSRAGGEIGVTELSKRLKLHKNNVFRLLATLELRGYVEQNTQTEDYRLGVKVLELGQSYLQQSSIVSRALPVIQELSQTSGETVSLAVLQNGQVQYPISFESKRPVKVAARVAVSFPAKVSAAGRLLTAQLSDAVLEEVLAANTPQDAAIRNQLTELRNNGSIIDRAAIEPDVVTICQIVRDHNGHVTGAVELLAPQHRAKIEELQPLVDAAAKNLSKSLGSRDRSTLGRALEKEVTTTATVSS